MFLLLDDFSGYNQVLVSEHERHKITFRTKWATFSFKRMHCVLINASASFQHSMDITFCCLIVQNIVVYLDDLTLLSKRISDHLHHLKQIFEGCRKYDISLNPKKSIFTVSNENLLGHIITKSGIKLDLDRVKTITHTPFPINMKVMQSFLRKINFLRKFIFD